MRSRTREAVIYDEHSCSRKFNLLRPAGADAEEASQKKQEREKNHNVWSTFYEIVDDCEVCDIGKSGILMNPICREASCATWRRLRRLGRVQKG